MLKSEIGPLHESLDGTVSTKPNTNTNPNLVFYYKYVHPNLTPKTLNSPLRHSRDEGGF